MPVDPFRFMHNYNSNFVCLFAAYNMFHSYMRWTCPEAGRSVAYLQSSHEGEVPSEIFRDELSQFLSWDRPVTGALFVFGGRSGRLGDASQYLSSVEYLDPTLLEWRRGPDMKFARVGLAAVYLDEHFYVIGGYNQQSSEPQRSVERLSINSMQWESCAHLLVPRYGHSACVCRGLIYVMGGDHSGILVPFAERYDPKTNKWERVPDMPLRVAASRALCIDDKIYLFGGCDPSVPGDRASDAILMFDPDVKRWTILSKRMRLGRTAFSLAPLTNGRTGVMIAGGFDLSSRPEIEVGSVEIIKDLRDDTNDSERPVSPTLQLPPLPIPRAGCQGVAIPTSNFPVSVWDASEMPFIVLGGEYVDPMTGRCRVFDSATMLVNSDFAENMLGSKKIGITGFAGRALMALKRRRQNSSVGETTTAPLQWSDQVIPPMLRKRTAFAACVGNVWPRGFTYSDLSGDSSTADSADLNEEPIRTSLFFGDWFA